jgi:HEPN domain-containing protein
MARRPRHLDPLRVLGGSSARCVIYVQEDLSQKLLSLARDDEFAARALLAVDGVAETILGFHCQQAVEKALKAALASRHIKFPHTHDLAGLIELCRQADLGVPKDLQGADRLAPYGVQMRYESTHAAALDRAQALRWAEAAVEWAAGLERSRAEQDLWQSRSPHDRADR